jgi:phosphoribosylformylglycinamidine (FGAM) synthase PurS component
MMHPIKLYVVYMGDVQRPEKMNDSQGKTMHRVTMERGFTVNDHNILDVMEDY